MANSPRTSTKPIAFEAEKIARADADLVRRCRRNDPAAWDELVARYQRLIYAIPRRAGLSEEQAADVFQEVFLTLLEKINDIEQPGKIRSWMVTTAKFKTWAVVAGQRAFIHPRPKRRWRPRWRLSTSRRSPTIC